MKSTEQAEFDVVRGIVVPTAWGVMGEPRLVAILTPDEGEHNVAPIMAGVDLLSHLREEVEARIVVETGQEGRKTIKVVSFIVVGAIGPDSDAADTAPVNHTDGLGRRDSGPMGG